jgi:hypothetical protein
MEAARGVRKGRSPAARRRAVAAGGARARGCIMNMNGVRSRVLATALAACALVVVMEAGAAEAEAPTVCSGDLGEPNDTFATAYFVSCGLTFSAKICTSTDVDYYWLLSAYGGSTVITMTPPASRDYDMVIYDASQNPICTRTGPTGAVESCTLVLSAFSNYYVKIYGYQGSFSATEPYTLRWTCVSATAPTVTTGTATSVERGRATLNLTVNPNGANTSAWTQYGTDTSYGATTGTYGVGYGTSPVTVGTNAPNLVCGTLYHYKAVAQNDGGQGTGFDATFTTGACIAPTVITGSATDIEATRATLNVQVNPNSSEAWVWAEYGPTTSYGAQTGEYGVGHGDGQFTQPTNAPNLTCGTLYHYRARGRNSAGQFATPGADATFTTLPCSGPRPAVTTNPVSAVGPARVTLRSTVNPNGSATGAWFNYGPTAGYGATTPAIPVGAGTSDVSVRGGLRGLACGTSYHAQAGATNGSGPSTGGDVAFTTLGCGGGVAAHAFTPFADVPGVQAQVHDLGVDSDGWLYELAPLGSGLAVYRSTDGGATFGGAVALPNSAFANWAYALHVDPSDVVHVVWMGNTASESWYSRSTDRGQSFSPPKNVRTGAVFNGYWAQNAVNPVVASDGWGRVYVAFGAGTRTAGGSFVGYDVWVARSADGGATFQPEFYTYPPTAAQDIPRRIVATPTGFYVLFVDESAWDLYLHRGDATAYLLNATRVNANPGRVLYGGDVAADDVGTTVHVAYSDTTTDSEGDILYCKSLDGGATWPPCVRVNDSVYRWQEQPRIVRDGYGTLHVAWADLRSNFRYQTYYAASTDGGATFSANVNLSASQAANNSTQARLGLDEAGRRLYVTASRDYAQVAWTRGSYARNPPTVTTLPAGAVTAMGATLNAAVNPAGSLTTVKFEYGTTTGYGLETTPQDAGSGTTTVNVAAPVSALVCGTLYHFRAVAQNAAGPGEGEDLPFTTTACPPAVTPQPASAVTSSSATLHAGVNPNGFVTSVRFEYGTTPAYGTQTPIQELPAVNQWIDVSAPVAGLTCATLYHFHALATNAGGTTPGLDGTFTTGVCPPTVTTQPAGDIGMTTATLNGSLNPNGGAATAWFEYGPTPALGTVSPPQAIPAGSVAVPVSQAVGGLTCGTRYYFLAKGSNAGGPAEGLTLTFDSARCPYKKGDLNLDLQTDLVLRNLGTGQNVTWLMSGITRLSEAAVTPDPVVPEWQIAGVDDFSGDGRNDLALWHSTGGQVEFWLMNGTTRVGDPVPLGGASSLPPPWKLSATADFNHDAMPDLVWRNSSTQKIVIWTLDGMNVSGALVPNPDQAADPNWEIVAALDFNADGNTDLLWYNWSSGKIVLWFMDASVQRIGGQFTNPPSANDANWKVLAAGDYGVGPGGLAGTNDVVWRNASSGKYVVWYMDNAGNRTSGSFTAPDSPANPLGWTIAGPR